MVCSSDGDIDFLDIVAGVLQKDTLAPYLFKIFLDYVCCTSIDLIKENGSALKKDKLQTMPNRNYYGRRLGSASCKYTHPSRITVT